MATHSSILAGESHGQRSLVGYSPRGHTEWDTAEHARMEGLSRIPLCSRAHGLHVASGAAGASCRPADPASDKDASVSKLPKV